MKLFIISFCIFISFTLHAETLKLVTGEYAPYSGEKLVNGGLSTELVKAVFNEIHQDITIEFTPWIRAMNYLKTNAVAGSFPWTKNSEREGDLLYSMSIHTYEVASFLKKGSDLDKKFDLTNKKICEPNGWDIEPFKETIEKYKMQMVRPINMESCFRMLALGRVDIISGNRYVGEELIRKIFGDNPPVVSRTVGLINKPGMLYFIVPKSYPNAQKIISDFNRGLEILKKNGKYDQMMNKFKKENL